MLNTCQIQYRCTITVQSILQEGDFTTTVNFKLEGELDEFVQNYIKSGLATSKTEVLRIGLHKLREHYHESMMQKNAQLGMRVGEIDKSIR